MASLNKLSKPRKGEKRIGESELREIVESDRFYNKPKILRFAEYSEIFYFYKIGDFLKGFLISRQTSTLTHYRQVTYKMKVQKMRQDGKDYPIKGDLVVEFPGLKYLQRNIDKNELIGSNIRIVYIGRKKTGLGHSAKIFDVFKDLGITSRKEIYQDGSKRKYKKRPKTNTGPKRGPRRARVTAKM